MTSSTGDADQQPSPGLPPHVREDARSAAIDPVTRLRRRVLPVLHRIKEPFGGFAQCTLDPAEYVGRVDRPLDRFREDLRRAGFEPEPIASLKRHGDGRLSAGSWVRRRSPLAEKQLHVTLLRPDDGADAVDVYAHTEYSWIRHPCKHYTSAGWDAEAGVRELREALEAHGLEVSRPADDQQ